MKKLILTLTLLTAIGLFAKDKGDKCFHDAECGGMLECKSNVCVKKEAFDHGSKQSGKSCSVDSQCIGAGKCQKNIHGQGVCTGN